MASVHWQTRKAIMRTQVLHLAPALFAILLVASPTLGAHWAALGPNGRPVAGLAAGGGTLVALSESGPFVSSDGDHWHATAPRPVRTPQPSAAQRRAHCTLY